MTYDYLYAEYANTLGWRPIFWSGKDFGYEMLLIALMCMGLIWLITMQKPMLKRHLLFGLGVGAIPLGVGFASAWFLLRENVVQQCRYASGSDIEFVSVVFTCDRRVLFSLPCSLALWGWQMALFIRRKGMVRNFLSRLFD